MPHGNGFRGYRGAARKQSRLLHPSRAADPAAGVLEGPVRLNRYIARSGVSSRRKADELIAAGHVKVNGEVVTEMGLRVEPGDRVEVSGRTISPQGLVYLLLNKPDDVITTNSDERGRRTVLDLVELPPSRKEGLFPVGRLDRHTVGALVITNDGELAHRLMHPRYRIDKIYSIRTRDPVKPHQLDELRRGVMLEDGRAKAEQVAYVDPANHHEIAMLLHEGRNRQVRRMLEALGHGIERLERTSYGGLTTEGIRRGKWRELSVQEVRRLRRLVQLK